MKSGRLTVFAVLLSVFCTWLMLRPSSGFPAWPWLKQLPADKLVHIVIFCALLTVWSLSLSPVRNRKYIIVLLVIYGFLIEILQNMMGLGRSFEWADWAADLSGIALGLLVLRVISSSGKIR